MDQMFKQLEEQVAEVRKTSGPRAALELLDSLMLTRLWHQHPSPHWDDRYNPAWEKFDLWYATSRDRIYRALSVDEQNGPVGQRFKAQGILSAILGYRRPGGKWSSED